MQRVLIIGCSGAGKSTFAPRLAARTGLPLIHLDKEFWLPDWTPMRRPAWRAKVADLVAGKAWIMEGNYGNSLDLRLPRADTVIWFDYPRHVCIRRILKRVLTTYGEVRADMAPGCTERFDLDFLRWVWRFDRDEQPPIAAALAAHGARLSPVIFRGDWEARAFLDTVRPPDQPR